jgi:predicted transcriptional regulator
MNQKNVTNTVVWEELNVIWQKIKAVYRPALSSELSESKISRSDWGLLLAVLKFEPEETTPGHLMIRNPFTAAEVYRERLEELTSAGYLRKTQAGKFVLTSTGRELTERLINNARNAMDRITLNPDESVDMIFDSLNRLLQASLEAPSPPNNWSIGLSYKLMPPAYRRIPYIEQTITCIAAYYDDSYLAAWRKSRLSATALETLTLFWRGEANSYDTLCDRLAHRGHSCDVYAGIVDDLRALEYVKGSNDDLWITPTGRLVRIQIEDDTEKYFYNPWKVLEDDEKTRLLRLLQEFST